jgi:hypothetical protein
MLDKCKQAASRHLQLDYGHAASSSWVGLSQGLLLLTLMHFFRIIFLYSFDMSQAVQGVDLVFWLQPSFML